MAYLLTDDVAALTRAPRATVRYWRYKGTGPAWFKVGRRVLYDTDVVNAWLAEAQSGQSGTRPLSGQDAGA